MSCGRALIVGGFDALRVGKGMPRFYADGARELLEGMEGRYQADIQGGRDCRGGGAVAPSLPQLPAGAVARPAAARKRKEYSPPVWREEKTMQTINGINCPTYDHPEIGLVLDSQCGAQSEGCAYDTPDLSEAAAPEWLKSVLSANRVNWSRGEPGTIGAVLASDGWWWRVN